MKKNNIAGLFIFGVFLAVLNFFNSNETTMEVSVTSLTSKPPIYSIRTNKPQVALTFNAAWGFDSIGTILELFEQYGMKATFFVTEGWINQSPQSLREIQKAGHELGYLESLPQAENPSKISQIAQTHNKVKELTGVEMQLFRVFNKNGDSELATKARDYGYEIIQWNIDSNDWKNYGPADIANTVANNPNLGPGSIVLFRIGAQETLEALEECIIRLQNQGYEMVTVSQLKKASKDDSGLDLPEKL